MTCWLYAQKIQELKDYMVWWGDFEVNEVNIMLVDGVHC
jgi:hypothetical protein